MREIESSEARGRTAASAELGALSQEHRSDHVDDMKAISVSDLWRKRLGDWVINPYVGCEHACKHCYCPAMPGVKFNNQGRSQEEWGSYLIPKVGIVEALQNELRVFTPAKSRRTAWGDGRVLMSFLTDAYTPREASLKLTRGCLQSLLEAGHRVRILTRSALVERDFDIMRAHREQVLLGTSIPYLDDALARTLEPRASSPTRRIAMLRKARGLGIDTFVAIAPFLPGDPVANLEQIVSKISGLVTAEIFCEVLNAKGSNLKMMISALDHVPALQQALAGYTREAWAKHTWKILTEGARLDARWVPWPDTGRLWRSDLTAEQVSTLDGWLPREN